MKSETNAKQKPTYESPRIIYKGQLKQFAGSPLSKPRDGNPLGLPGQ